MNYARQYPRFWLVYFIVGVVVTAVSVLEALLGVAGHSSLSQSISAAYGVVGLIPLYGFVRQRRYKPRWLWLMTLVVTALALVAVLGIGLITSVGAGSVIPLALTVLISGLSAPFVFALHQYVFRSPHLWLET